MAKKRQVYIRRTVSLTRDDNQALDSAALTLDRDPQWVLGKLAHLAVGTIPLSVEIRRWLRGDTAWDAGLSGDQTVLLTIGNPDPPVVKAQRRRTVAEAPPTQDEVAAHCREKGYGFSPEEFHAFYSANGWVQGRAGKPLIDWKAACHSWQIAFLQKNPQAVAVSDWGKDRPAETEEVVDDQTLPLVEDGSGDGYLDDQDA